MAIGGRFSGAWWLTVIMVVVLMAIVLPRPVHAVMVDVTLDPNKFGTVDQNNTQCPDVNCGPTAAVNSFVYLQTAFPDIYKAPLVPATKGVDVANTLNGKGFMNTCCVEGGGTSIGDFVLGKMTYVEQQDKGVTRYIAQMTDEWSAPGHPGATKPTFVRDNTKPTITFIAEELRAGEDVEIALKPRTGPGHYVTVTGITFDTETGKGTILFIDPNGGKAGKADISRAAGEDVSIVTQYMINDQVTRVVGAIAESPVPEPSTFVLLGSAAAFLGGVIVVQRRRTRSRPARACADLEDGVVGHRRGRRGYLSRTVP